MSLRNVELNRGSIDHRLRAPERVASSRVCECHQHIPIGRQVMETKIGGKLQDILSTPAPSARMATSREASSTSDRLRTRSRCRRASMRARGLAACLIRSRLVPARLTTDKTGAFVTMPERDAVSVRRYTEA